MIRKGSLRYTRHRMSTVPRRGYSCKHCGSNDHYSYTCFQRPKKSIKSESDKTKYQRKATNRKWFVLNPPEADGLYTCYLQIADDCPKRLVPQMAQSDEAPINCLQLEHVRSRARSPKLRFQPLNIKPACRPCNKLKRSWSVEELAETYPRIFDLITTPDWQAYDQQLTELESSL